VQVMSTYTTDEIRLDAMSDAAARAEAETHYVEFEKLYEKTPEV